MALPARDASFALDAIAEPDPHPAELRDASGEPARRACKFIVPTTHADIAVWQSAGRKLPVLLVHAAATCKEVFRAQMDSVVGQEYRLIAVDLPGHGESSDAFDPDRSYSIAGYADALVEVIEALGIDRVALVGWSLGGHVGMELMGCYPDLVGVMAVGAQPSDVFPGRLGQAFERGEPTEAEVERFVRTVSERVEVPELRAAVSRTDGRARQGYSRSLEPGCGSSQPGLAETSAHVALALVDGADDPVVKADDLSEVRSANLWRNRRHVLPCAGHAPFLDVPQIFNSLLSSFLSDVADIAEDRSADPDLAFSG